MYSTQVYLYQQKQEVLLVDDNDAIANKRWRIVYAKNLKLNKGVDNVILFQFYNQDQKPVDVSDSDFVFRLIDQTGQTLLLTEILEPVNLLKGRTKLVIRSHDLDSVVPQICSYSLTRVRDEGIIVGDSSIVGTNFVEATLVDDHAGARGTIEVVDSVYPAHRLSTEITVPHQFNLASEVYTSHVDKSSGGITTFQLFFDQFDGLIDAEGSVGSYGTWFAALAEPVQIMPSEGSAIITVAGHFDRVRLKMSKNNGAVLRILAR